jgi:hypothetical protein
LYDFSLFSFFIFFCFPSPFPFHSCAVSITLASYLNHVVFFFALFFVLQCFSLLSFNFDVPLLPLRFGAFALFIRFMTFRAFLLLFWVDKQR